MSFIHKLIPSLLSATLSFGVTGGGALAATPPTPRTATVRCTDGACTVEAPLDGVSPLVRAGAALGLSALQSKAGPLPVGVRLTIDDDLVLTLPVGEITLPQAQLDVEMGADNRIARLRGRVETPFPTLGVLSDVRMVQPAIAEVGLDTGQNLSHLHAALVPDRQYLFFDIASGLDMASRVAGTGESLSLSAPAGQALTLIVDTQEPLVYLAGNVTVNHSGEMLLAGPLQELAQRSELIPDALPTRQRTQVTVEGLAGKHVDEYLKLGGAWSVDAGALGQWLGGAGEPLAVEGLLTLSAEGMWVDGVVRASIAPDTLLDSGVHLTAFAPFQGDRADAFVEVKADVAIPLANVAAAASARLDSAPDTPTAGDTAARELAAAQTVAAQPAPSPSPSGETRQRTPALQAFLAAVNLGAASSAQAIKDLAARGGDWLATLPDLDLGTRIQRARASTQK